MAEGWLWGPQDQRAVEGVWACLYKQHMLPSILHLPPPAHLLIHSFIHSLLLSFVHSTNVPGCLGCWEHSWEDRKHPGLICFNVLGVGLSVSVSVLDGVCPSVFVYKYDGACLCVFAYVTWPSVR